MKVNIFGVDLDNYSYEEAIAIIIERVSNKASPEYVVTPNAHHLIQLQKNSQLLATYRNAFLSIPDGIPLFWVAKLRNKPLKNCISRTSLLSGLCAEAANQNLKVFFLGGGSDAAKQAATKLKQKYFNLRVDTYCSSANLEQNATELAKINQIIENAAPDILFVGFSSPQQEIWIATNHQQLKVPISICIGGSFELFSEVAKVAPLWIQDTGLEWLYYLLAEPGRLFKKDYIS